MTAVKDIEDRLHAASAGRIEAELVAIACEQTGAEHGALFVWDKDANGLVLVHHVVNGITVTLPRVVRHDGPKAGIALHVFDTDKARLSPSRKHRCRIVLEKIDGQCVRSASAALTAGLACSAPRTWIEPMVSRASSGETSAAIVASPRTCMVSISPEARTRSRSCRL